MQMGSNATKMGAHADLCLHELVQIEFAGPMVMGFLELRLISTVRRVCKALHAVPLERRAAACAPRTRAWRANMGCVASD